MPTGECPFQSYRSTLPLILSSLEKPSAIERRAVLPIIKGRDAIIQAQVVINRTTLLPISVLQKVRGLAMLGTLLG